MNATPSELLMRNFNEIFIELDPVKRLTLLKESFTDDCLWVHPGGRIVGREGINEAATEIRKHFPQYRYLDLTRGTTSRLVVGEAGCRVNHSAHRRLGPLLPHPRRAAENDGCVRLVDEYTFSETGRRVRNPIESRFQFRDG